MNNSNDPDRIWSNAIVNPLGSRLLSIISNENALSESSHAA